MKKLLCLTRYDTTGASSRYRMYQFMPGLESAGWCTTVSPLLANGYVAKLYATGRPPALPALLGLVRRLGMLKDARRFDTIWIEKELFPWLPGFLEKSLARTDLPYAVDYDEPSSTNMIATALGSCFIGWAGRSTASWLGPPWSLQGRPAQFMATATSSGNLARNR